MTWWLTWDNGTGGIIRSGFATQEDAEAQGAADEAQFPGRGATVGSDEAPIEPPVEETPVDPPVDPEPTPEEPPAEPDPAPADPPAEEPPADPPVEV